MSNREGRVIFLTEERVLGELVTMGAYYSTVKYVKGQMEYEVMVENNEFVFLEDMVNEYESD